MDLPKPKNWQEFESIVCDAQGQRWQSTLQKNGRGGQQQNGVDIYGPDNIGRLVGIQCKRYEFIDFKLVEDEVKNAKEFKGRLTTLFIATTADYDAILQARVRELSEKRVVEGDFSVGILFWGDIVSSLLLHKSLMQAHYPQIALSQSREENRERLLAALEMGFYGADLWAFIELTFGEAGWMTNTDSDELIAKLRVIEHRTQQLLLDGDAEPIVEALRKIRAGCNLPKRNKSVWDMVALNAKRVSNRMGNATSLLAGKEADTMELALQLGRIYHYIDEGPPIETRRSIERLVRRILPSDSDELITRKFKEAEDISSGHGWSLKIFNLMTQQVRLGF